MSATPTTIRMKAWTKQRRWQPPPVPVNLVREFLEYKRDSFNWIKQVPRAELLRGLDGFKFNGPPPFLHQLACFNIGIEHPHFLFLLDMGAGKSKLMLDLVRWHQQHSGLRRVLIMVPKAVNVQAWLDEIAEHAPGLTATALMGLKDERQELITAETDLYLINYAGLAVYMSEFVKVKQKHKKVRRRTITPRSARNFAERFDMVVLDECHKLGNHEALVYRECRWFTKYCRFRYGLTGTPFGRDPVKLWAQFHIIDDGATLGDSLGLFRASLFDASQNHWGGIDYEFDQRMQPDLRRMIRHRSIYYSDKEFDDLPPVHRIKRRVRFSVSADEQYRNVLTRIREARGDLVELQNAYYRMRMVTSGYLSVKSELDDKKRLVHFFDENPKLEALEDMLEDLPEDSKCIVYHDYQITGRMLCAMLRRRKWRFAELSGLTEDSVGQINSFLHDPTVRFMVANNESGATGINPQKVCNYAIFYESPSSPITRRQAEKRLSRTGQRKHVYLYDLVVPNSVDEKILSYLKQGKDLFASIMSEGKKVLL